MPDSLGLELLPADDEGLSPAEELASATAAATATPGAIVPAPEAAPVPLGRTWAFDWVHGQFIRSGGAPAPRVGFAAVQEYVQMVVHTERYAHRVFSDEFGMEGSQAPVGEMRSSEVVSQYEQHLREALLVHDRITAVENFSARFDPAAGVLTIIYFEVVTDEEQVIPIANIALTEQRGVS